MLESSLFYTLAFFLLFGAINMIWARRTVFSAISFLLVMLSMAGMFALLHNSFLFLAQTLVSVGAVVTISLLVVVSTNIKEDHLPEEKYKHIWMIVTSIVLLPFIWLMFDTIASAGFVFPPVNESFGSLRALGLELFDDFVLPFELVSLLLLAAMIGAIVIARKESGHES